MSMACNCSSGSDLVTVECNSATTKTLFLVNDTTYVAECDEVGSAALLNLTCVAPVANVTVVVFGLPSVVHCMHPLHNSIISVSSVVYRIATSSSFIAVRLFSTANVSVAMTNITLANSASCAALVGVSRTAVNTSLSVEGLTTANSTTTGYICGAGTCVMCVGRDVQQSRETHFNLVMLIRHSVVHSETAVYILNNNRTLLGVAIAVMNVSFHRSLVQLLGPPNGVGNASQVNIALVATTLITSGEDYNSAAVVSVERFAAINSTNISVFDALCGASYSPEDGVVRLSGTRFHGVHVVLSGFSLACKTSHRDRTLSISSYRDLRVLHTRGVFELSSIKVAHVKSSAVCAVNAGNRTDWVELLRLLGRFVHSDIDISSVHVGAPNAGSCFACHITSANASYIAARGIFINNSGNACQQISYFTISAAVGVSLHLSNSTVVFNSSVRVAALVADSLNTSTVSVEVPWLINATVANNTPPHVSLFCSRQMSGISGIVTSSSSSSSCIASELVSNCNDDLLNYYSATNLSNSTLHCRDVIITVTPSSSSLGVADTKYFLERSHIVNLFPIRQHFAMCILSYRT